jgi:Uma2 family endonuclease
MSSLARRPLNRFSLEAYMLNERHSEVRHEFYHGEVYMMSGAQPNHVKIVSNVGALLHNQAARRGCHTATTDQLVRCTDDCYYYPDAVAVCGGEQFTKDPIPALVNFQLIVEVFSKSSEDYDRGSKFEEYRKVPTLIDYLLIAQNRIYAELHHKSEDSVWTLREYRSLEDVIPLQSISAELPLSEVYLNVFPAALSPHPYPYE